MGKVLVPGVLILTSKIVMVIVLVVPSKMNVVFVEVMVKIVVMNQHQHRLQLRLQVQSQFANPQVGFVTPVVDFLNLLVLGLMIAIRVGKVVGFFPLRAEATLVITILAALTNATTYQDGVQMILDTVVSTPGHGPKDMAME